MGAGLEKNMQIEVQNPDAYYGLTGTCVGCRRVTWLCRRDRRCSRYAKTPKRDHVTMPTGFYHETIPQHPKSEDAGTTPENGTHRKGTAVETGKRLRLLQGRQQQGLLQGGPC